MSKIIIEVPENCKGCHSFSARMNWEHCNMFDFDIHNVNRCPACLAAEVKEEHCEWEPQDRNAKLDKIIYSTSCKELLTNWGRYCQYCGKRIKIKE